MFSKLSRIVGIVSRARTQSVAQRERHIVAGTDVADIIEVLVEETLLLMHAAPLGDDAAATAYHARETIVGEVDVLQTYAAMYRKVVHSLFTLLDEGVTEYLPC